MEILFKIILLISCVVLILSILLQQGNSQGLSGSIGGGAEQLFGKKKGRGMDKFLKRVTLVFAVLFIVASLGILVYEPMVNGTPEVSTGDNATSTPETPTAPTE